ncbi:MAG: DUF4956 domain-containing protein [bacterium]|nr:DUF4956 domain-containing protein [bacterium]
MQENPLTQYYNLTLTEISAAAVVINILLAFALSAVVVWVWRRTHKSLSYSQSFAITIIMLGPLATAVMMVVRNNLIGAFALLGAFSLIRFRTIMKETRDVAFLFFSLTIGVAVGTNNYAIALITTVIISLVVLLLYKFNFGSRDKSGFLLTFETDDAFKIDTAESLFKKHTKEFELLHTKTGRHGREYAYTLHFEDNSKSHDFMSELQKMSGVTNSYLLTGKTTIEY